MDKTDDGESGTRATSMGVRGEWKGVEVRRAIDATRRVPWHTRRLLTNTATAVLHAATLLMFPF